MHIVHFYLSYFTLLNIPTGMKTNTNVILLNVSNFVTLISRLPSDPSRRNEWMSILKIPEFNEQSRVCHVHFSPESYAKGLKHKFPQLKKDALPTPVMMESFTTNSTSLPISETDSAYTLEMQMGFGEIPVANDVPLNEVPVDARDDQGTIPYKHMILIDNIRKLLYFILPDVIEEPSTKDRITDHCYSRTLAQGPLEMSHVPIDSDTPHKDSSHAFSVLMTLNTYSPRLTPSSITPTVSLNDKSVLNHASDRQGTFHKM